MSWNETFNTIYEDEFYADNFNKWKFALEKNRITDKLQLNVRLFKNTDKYNGPTKNGFIYPIGSVDELNKFQEALNKYFEDVKIKL